MNRHQGGAMNDSKSVEDRAWGSQSGNDEGAVVGGGFGGLIPAVLGRNYWACGEAASGEGTRGLTRGLKLKIRTRSPPGSKTSTFGPVGWSNR